MIRVLFIGLITVLVLLQYRLWVSDDGAREVIRLEQAVELRRSENATLTERNNALAAEVVDLKEGLAAVEERARSELGMVRDNESFFLVVPAGNAPANDDRPDN